MPYDPMTMSERIKQARTDRGLTQQQLADLVGVKQPTVAGWESGKHGHLRNRIARLAEVLGKKPQWIEFGHDHDDVAEGDHLPIVNVPQISWVAASQFVEIADPYEPGDSEGTVPIQYSRATLIALRVEGDSMDREFPPGVTIIVDYADKELVDGCFYVFRVGDCATLKRWKAVPPRLEPFSSNPDHEPIFPDDCVEVVGRVISSQKSY